MAELYRDYFDIDPEFFPAVNASVIEQHPNLWEKFYPHETFVEMPRQKSLRSAGKSGETGSQQRRRPGGEDCMFGQIWGKLRPDFFFHLIFFNSF